MHCNQLCAKTSSNQTSLFLLAYNVIAYCNTASLWSLLVLLGLKIKNRTEKVFMLYLVYRYSFLFVLDM
jgi:hypothetical protein